MYVVHQPNLYHVYMCGQHLHGIDNVHLCRECAETELDDRIYKEYHKQCVDDVSTFR